MFANYLPVMIKVLLISIDKEIKRFIESNYTESDLQFTVFNSTTDLLDIMSQVCSFHPSILLLDDDFTTPNSVHLLKNIRKTNPKMSIIFITSDSSYDLGRSVHNIGVTYYLLKPITEIELREYLKSIIRILNKSMSIHLGKLDDYKNGVNDKKAISIAREKLLGKVKDFMNRNI